MSNNGFDSHGEQTDGWRVELPSGEVVPIVITITQNFLRPPGAPMRLLSRVLDTVVASANLTAPDGHTWEAKVQDSSVRWALAVFARQLAANGWRVFVLAPGERSRAEAIQGALDGVATAAGPAFVEGERSREPPRPLHAALAEHVTQMRERIERQEAYAIHSMEAERVDADLRRARERALMDAASASAEPGAVGPLLAALMHALPYCYEPADQTVMCPECGAAWWALPEDFNENWHAPGCLLFAARVLVHQAVDVTHPREPGARDWKPDGPRPDARTPSEKLRDVVLTGWWQRVASIGYADVPEGVPPDVWARAVHAVMDRIPRPATGPYAADAGGP